MPHQRVKAPMHLNQYAHNSAAAVLLYSPDFLCCSEMSNCPSPPLNLLLPPLRTVLHFCYYYCLRSLLLPCPCIGFPLLFVRRRVYWHLCVSILKLIYVCVLIVSLRLSRVSIFRPFFFLHYLFELCTSMHVC